MVIEPLCTVVYCGGYGPFVVLSVDVCDSLCDERNRNRNKNRRWKDFGDTLAMQLM